MRRHRVLHKPRRQREHSVFPGRIATGSDASTLPALDVAHAVWRDTAGVPLSIQRRKVGAMGALGMGMLQLLTTDTAAGVAAMPGRPSLDRSHWTTSTRATR